MKITLSRIYKDTCTLGILRVGKEVFYTIEKPWQQNQQNVSCIPEGFYTFKPHGWRGENVRFERVWEIENVPNRSAILLHVGNYVQDVIGCVAIGMDINTGSNMVMNSNKAISRLRSLIGAQGGIIEIKSI